MSLTHSWQSSPVGNRKLIHILALVLALVAVPGIVLAQDTVPAETVSARQAYIDLINAVEDEGGIYAAELVEPLQALGSFFSEQGNYEQAADALARARQLLRINQGLVSVDELALLKALWQLALAQGDLRSAQNYENALVSLAQTQSGALATSPVYTALADQRLDLFDRFVSGERPPAIYAGCYYAKIVDYVALQLGSDQVLRVPDSRADCQSGNLRTVKRALLIEAIGFQGKALHALTQNEQYSSDEMLALMHEFFRSSDQLHRIMMRGTDYLIGPIWNKALGFDAQTAADQLRNAQLQLMFADLNLLRLGRRFTYEDYDVVYEQYQHAYRNLDRVGVGKEQLAHLFTPKVPVLLPTYLGSPFVEATGEQEGEYIDVAFKVDERGKPRRVVADFQTDGIARADRRRVVNYIKDSRFRPRIVDGTDVEAVNVIVRYRK